MQKKFTIISLFMILAVIVSACGTAVAQVPTGEPAGRTLSVIGSAQVSLAPDIAYITIGVHSENPDVKAAIDDNNARAEEVVAALASMGIAATDIRTTHFNIYPSQQYTPEGELRGTTYVVDNAVIVTLRDLDQIGDILDGAVEAGANTISGIQFDVADKDAALVEARQSAVTKARSLAEELATAAGVTLGQIQSINYYGGGAPPVPLYEARGGGMDMAVAGVPISTGQLTFNVDVNVVYAIQ